MGRLLRHRGGGWRAVGPAGIGAPHRVGSQLFQAVPCLRFPVSGAACRRLGSRTAGFAPVLGLSGVSASLRLDFSGFSSVEECPGPYRGRLVWVRGTRRPRGGERGGGEEENHETAWVGRGFKDRLIPTPRGWRGISELPHWRAGLHQVGKKGQRADLPRCPPTTKRGFCPALEMGQICPGASRTLWLFPSSRWLRL